MSEPKLTPAQEQWRARMYALLFTDAAWLAALAYERGDRAEGARIEGAVQTLVETFLRPDGIPHFAEAWKWALGAVRDGPDKAPGSPWDALAHDGRLH